jgi:hypothetical protein
VNTTCSPKKLGDADHSGVMSFYTVSTNTHLSRFCQFVSFVSAGVASPRKSDFVLQRRRSNTLNKLEVSANANFLAKLSNKEIYFKNGSYAGLN